MLFNSIQFVVFFVVTTGLYYVLPWRWRWKMLLAASCIFYMAFIPAYIAILFTTILIDYIMALLIWEASGKRRKTYLVISILSTCAVLFIFKYSAFFGNTVRELEGLLGITQDFPITHLLLPIGLSFHTFQSLSYVIEVYRGKQEPERNFGLYSLYVMFYPQLVAGPIERPQNLLHQFYQDHRFKVENLSRGLTLIAWGMFQKMVIADRCAVYVNNAYGSWQTQTGLTLLVATLLFALQIYGDFAGYSCIAIGCARVLGFELMTNFRRPYFSESFSEFWTRWHISLSTWFRDYLYIPLGGNRVSTPRLYLNLLITFAISGLWHGANWTFVAWGVYHALLLITERALGRAGWHFPRGFLGNAAQRVTVVGLACLGWVFFRAPSITAAYGILRRIFTATSLSKADLIIAITPFATNRTALYVASATSILIIVMLIVDLGIESGCVSRQAEFMASRKLQLFATVALFEIIMLFGVLRASAFIYFQF